jgi:hypothetical protein
MTDICAAEANLLMSRDIFDSLPTSSCDDIEAEPGNRLVKTVIGSRWYAVHQGDRRPIEIGTYVRED